MSVSREYPTGGGAQLRRQFASDNYAGICPEAWDAMAEANIGHAAAYGNDRWTEQSSALIRDLFETQCEVFFVFNGTAANSLALASMCQSYHSILCHELAHVETDECGAPEFFSNGTKVLTMPGEDGKIAPASINPDGEAAFRYSLPEAARCQRDAIHRGGRHLFAR